MNRYLIFNFVYVGGILATVLLWGSPKMTYGKVAQGVKDAKNGEINSKKVEESTADYQLSARVEKPLVHAGEPVVIQVTVKNNSKEMIGYGAPKYDRLFDIDVKNKNRETMPLTLFGKSLFVPQSESTLRVSGLPIFSLKPGESKTHRLLINRMYDMTVSGTYVIVAKLKIIKAEYKGTTELVSNPVKVEVGGFDASMPANPAPADKK